MKEHIIRAILYQDMSVKWKNAELNGGVNMHLNVHQKTRQFVEVELGDFLLSEGEWILASFEKTIDGDIHHENPSGMDKVDGEQGAFRLQIPTIVHNTPGEWGVQFLLATDYNPATGDYANAYPFDQAKFNEGSSFIDDGLTVPAKDNLSALYAAAVQKIQKETQNAANIATNAENISTLQTDLGKTNANVAKKADKTTVDAALATLQNEDEGLKARVGDLEVQLPMQVGEINTRVDEVESIAKGAQQAKSYADYQTMITDLNNVSLEDIDTGNAYRKGQSIYIVTVNVPDLWVAGITVPGANYSYIDDDTFVNELKTNGIVQVGYFVLGALETGKVALTDYPTKADLATVQKILEESIAALPQADYEQNDETSSDYIKNRPFYEEMVEGYSPINLIYIEKFPKEEVPVEGLSVFELEWSEGIKEGDVLAVTVNGQTYSDLIYNGEEVLGNELIVENPAADGLPFALAFADIYENSMIAQIAVKGSDYDGSDFSLKKKGIVNKVKQIDEKFIPDTIARTKDVDKKIEEKMPTNYITTDSDQGELTGVKTWSSGNKTLEFDPFNHINYSSSSDDNNKTDFSFDFNTGEFNLTSNTHYQSEETLFEQGSFEYHYSYNDSNVDIRTADLKANSQEITGSCDRGVGRGIGSFSISYDGFSCSWLHAEATIQNSLDVSSYGISYQFTETTGDTPYSQYSGQLLFPKEGGEGTIATREWAQENVGTKWYKHAMTQTVEDAGTTLVYDLLIVSTRETAYTAASEIVDDWINGKIDTFYHSSINLMRSKILCINSDYSFYGNDGSHAIVTTTFRLNVGTLSYRETIQKL